MDKREAILKIELLEAAKAKGICSAGYKEMGARDIDALVEYYIANPDWCMERGFPSLSSLRENFANYTDKGVFVDHEFTGERLDGRLVYIFHHCKGSIRVGLNINEAIIPMLYFANGCDMDVEIEDGVKIPMYVFGSNEVREHGGIARKYINPLQ